MPPRYVFLEETFLPSLPTLQPLDLYRRTLACLVLAVSCLGGGGLWADDARTSVEQRSNAVSQVLLGIFSYVRWPKEPAVLQLCVVGPTEYADGLLRGMVQANGRRVHAERRAVDNPDLGTLCNVIYLGVVDERERQQVSAAWPGIRSCPSASVAPNAASAACSASTSAARASPSRPISTPSPAAAYACTRAY